MKTVRTLAAIACLAAVGPVLSGGVAGQKLDSGLGELPHYSKWADPSGRSPLRVAVVGESLDSGLGELPHYSKWIDRTGRDPMGANTVRVATSAR
jgi:hypothetical protein